jgi:photosystem II stability/assembly factor-like uncharacterized protein
LFFVLKFSGGHDGKTQLRDIWISRDDGYTWSSVCEAAPWPSRQGHATAVSNDSVYIMGGFGGSQRFNDFWQTSDCGKLLLLLFLFYF